jgi:hypothetical protein
MFSQNTHAQVGAIPNSAPPPVEQQGLQGLISNPVIGGILLKAAKEKIESTLKNDKNGADEKKGPVPPADNLGQMTLNINKHIPPMQLNLHANQAPTATFGSFQPPPPPPQTAFHGNTVQPQPPAHEPVMINLDALLGMFCGGRNNQAPNVQQVHPHMQQGATIQQYPAGVQQPVNGTMSHDQTQHQAQGGMFNLGFLKNIPFVNFSPQTQPPAPPINTTTDAQTSTPAGPQTGSGKPPLMFQRGEGSKENELILLQPSTSTRAETGQQATANPVPSSPRPFQQTVAAGMGPAPANLPQQQQPQPVTMIDLGALLGMFCGGHHQQQQAQANQQQGAQQQKQGGFNLNFFRNFSFSQQQAPPQHQVGHSGNIESHPAQTGADGNQLAVVGNQLLSSIEYRQNHGVSLNLGNLVNGVGPGDLNGQLQAFQQENTELKEKLHQLEQERNKYTLPAVSIGMDFQGYKTLVHEVNTYCREFKQELSQAQLDYINTQLRQAFEDRLAGLFKEVKLNTKEELELFLTHSNQTLVSLKAVYEDLVNRLKDAAVVLDLKDKSRLLEPLEQQISSLERRIEFFSSERHEATLSEGSSQPTLLEPSQQP